MNWDVGGPYTKPRENVNRPEHIKCDVPDELSIYTKTKVCSSVPLRHRFG